MKVDRAAIYEAAKKLSNWGRWAAWTPVNCIVNVQMWVIDMLAGGKRGNALENTAAAAAAEKSCGCFV